MTDTEEQPRELAARAVAAARRCEHPGAESCDPWWIADAVLAAVTPLIRRQVAEERTYPNVKIGDEEYEHYDRLGPGCWHPVKGMGPCLSWQGLIREAEFRARIRATQTIDEEQSNG